MGYRKNKKYNYEILKKKRKGASVIYSTKDQ